MENKRQLAKRICAVGVVSAMFLTPTLSFANNGNAVGKGNVLVNESQNIVETQRVNQRQQQKQEEKFERKQEQLERKDQKQEEKFERKQEQLERKNQKTQERLQRKEEIRLSYTQEEIVAIETAGKKIKAENKDVKVLPFNSVGLKKGHMKFDTPPVIKGGRTLVPVRAITQGLGAEVSWSNETSEVTITKEDITIVIEINSNLVTVNGVIVEIDAPAEILSNRTYVPLRFIAETFNLKVDWDEETETIEIIEEDDGDNEEDLGEEAEKIDLNDKNNEENNDKENNEENNEENDEVNIVVNEDEEVHQQVELENKDEDDDAEDSHNE